MSEADAESAAAELADVVIVGGRPAGASLAARLGKAGLRVIVVDRDDFPSLPSVPSSPILYPSALALLDELEIAEASYADASARITAFGVEFAGHFTTKVPMPKMHGRDYALGLDRASFDLALWRNLDRFPSVTALSGFTVTDVLRDDASGPVRGVIGKDARGETRELRARWTIGADGRFSLVARKVGARIEEDHSEKVSTVYQSVWEDVLPFEGEGDGLASLFTTGRGQNVLFFSAPERRTMVIVHMRADRVDVKGDAEAFYHGVLASHPAVHRRVEKARRVAPVVGMKRIGNRYLTHGGEGWLLVGDALHHKDPVDGQGIYDALVEAKRLAELLVRERAAGLDAARVVARYGEAIEAETKSMFRATMQRLERELYEEPPALVIRTMIRWMMTDPVYQNRFARFLGRDIPPDSWLPPSLIAAAVARGIGRDLRGMVGR